MQEAYDHVDWNSLDQNMIQFGFSTKFISLLDQCLSADSLSIFLNVNVFDNIKLKEGFVKLIISPLFCLLSCKSCFLVCFIIWKLEGNIHGIKIAGTSHSISHLFLASDIMISCRPNQKDIENIIECLRVLLELEWANG